jgi:outer membrane immunogenic protein
VGTQAKIVGSVAALASAAAASGSALAGDPPLKSTLIPPPPAVPTWQGFYVGGSLGASWLSSVSDDSGAQPLNYGRAVGLDFAQYTETGGSRAMTSGLGWLGALQAGYNFQNRNFVYGVEGDFAWLGSTKTSLNGQHVLNYTFNYFPVGTFSANSNAPTTRSSQVNELALLRGRFGVDFGGTLPYLTAGLALGNVKNSYSIEYFGNGYAASNSSWVPGVVLGGGLEHQLNEHWSLRGEILWVGFKDQTLNHISGLNGFSGYAATVRFSNDLMLGQIGVNYKF